MEASTSGVAVIPSIEDSLPAIVLPPPPAPSAPAQSEDADALQEKTVHDEANYRKWAPKNGRKRICGDTKFPYNHFSVEVATKVKQCNHCPQQYGPNTSFTVLKRHVKAKHRIKDPQNEKEKGSSVDSTGQSMRPLKQLRFGNTSWPKTPLSQQKRDMLDDEVVRLIVCTKQPHSFSENPAFRRYAQKSSGEPSYVPIGRHTVQRRIKDSFKNKIPLLIAFLAAISGRFSLAFDGWSNCNMRGYYSVTLHWFCEKVRYCSYGASCSIFSLSNRHVFYTVEINEEYYS